MHKSFIFAQYYLQKNPIFCCYLFGHIFFIMSISEDNLFIYCWRSHILPYLADLTMVFVATFKNVQYIVNIEINLYRFRCYRVHMIVSYCFRAIGNLWTAPLSLIIYVGSNSQVNVHVLNSNVNFDQHILFCNDYLL